MAAPERIDAGDPAAVDAAAIVLAAGGVVLLPTDTVYGIAASTTVAGATDALFDLKGRNGDAPLAVLVADGQQARTLASWVSDGPVDHLVQRWPGPLTVVLRRHLDAQALALGGDSGTIGVRCPDHDLVRAIARRVGPIATTSANRSGDETPSDASSAAASLLGPVDLIIDGGPAGTVASTVVDATVRPFQILRQGALRVEDIG